MLLFGFLRHDRRYYANVRLLVQFLITNRISKEYKNTNIEFKFIELNEINICQIHPFFFNA